MTDKAELRKQIIECILSTSTLSEGIAADAVLELFNQHQAARIAELEEELNAIYDSLESMEAYNTGLEAQLEVATKALGVIVESNEISIRDEPKRYTLAGTRALAALNKIQELSK